MKFLTNFFNDEGAVIGLCRFKLEKENHDEKSLSSEVFFNPFKSGQVYETNFSKNILLV